MSQVFNFINSSNIRAACEQGALFAPVIWLRTVCEDLPIDLTGYGMKMQVRLTAESTDVVLTIGTVEGNATISTLAGKLSINVSSTVTTDLVPGLYVYDLDLIQPDAEILRILQGQFEITAGVTR